MIKWVFVEVLLYMVTCSGLLAKVDLLNNYAKSAGTFPANFAGLSLSFPDMYTSGLSSTVFQGLLKNSWVFGSIYGSWSLSLKMQWPVGYKYNCSAYTSFAPNATCIININNY